MFAVAFDLTVAVTEAVHPRGQQQAYADIQRLLGDYGFRRIQGSVYVTDDEDLANLAEAMDALRALPWFSASVRDIRAFRVEQWSDFTAYVKRPAA